MTDLTPETLAERRKDAEAYQNHAEADAKAWEQTAEKTAADLRDMTRQRDEAEQRWDVEAREARVTERELADLRARIEALADEKATLAAKCEALVAETLAYNPDADYDDLHRNRADAEELRTEEAALRAALSPTDPTKEGGPQ